MIGMMLKSLVVMIGLMVVVQGRSKPHEFCTDDHIYSPCECSNEVDGKLIDLTCREVSPREVMYVMGRVQKHGKDINSFIYENNDEKTEELPENFFLGVSIWKMTLMIPSLTKLHRNTFQGETGNLYELFINGSMMNSIPSEVLNYLVNLEAFGMEDSELEEMSAKSWEDVDDEVLSKIRVLYLDDNGIRSVSKGTFERFTRLRHLSLSDNLLHDFHPDALPSSRELQTLSLSGNALREFPSKIVKKMEPEGWLSLERTNIRHLSSSDMKKIHEKKLMVDIKYNDFNCNCALKAMVERMEEDEDAYTLVGECHFPEGLRGREIFSLRKDDMDFCFESDKSESSHRSESDKSESSHRSESDKSESIESKY